MRRGSFVVSLFVAGAAFVAAVPVARAQNPQYPPPTTGTERTVERCVMILRNGVPYNGNWQRGMHLQIKGLSQCARSLERNIRATMRSRTYQLARFDASEDGSYVSPIFTVPLAR